MVRKKIVEKAVTVGNGTQRQLVYTFFFYKNVVFPVQAEYSCFSADFRLKIFLYYS